MINIEKFYETIEKRKSLHINYPNLEEEVWKPRLDALGEDEDEIIEFMDNADKEVLEAFWPVYDDLMDKFPSEKMDKAIDRYLENYKKVCN